MQKLSIEEPKPECKIEDNSCYSGRESDFAKTVTDVLSPILETERNQITNVQSHTPLITCCGMLFAAISFGTVLFLKAPKPVSKFDWVLFVMTIGVCLPSTAVMLIAFWKSIHVCCGMKPNSWLGVERFAFNYLNLFNRWGIILDNRIKIRAGQIEAQGLLLQTILAALDEEQQEKIQSLIQPSTPNISVRRDNNDPEFEAIRCKWLHGVIENLVTVHRQNVESLEKKVIEQNSIVPFLRYGFILTTIYVFITVVSTLKHLF